MPELAEVEFYRRKWNSGLEKRITRVHLHSDRRILRGIDTKTMADSLRGATLHSSAVHGKQMLFGFSKQLWLGVHLGMTGELLVKGPDFEPAKHDHLVLYQRECALVFRDPRLFGRVLFTRGREHPEWWRNLPPQIQSPLFTAEFLRERLIKHRSLPLKAALLDQATFPGIGNWMADEILWQSRLHPRALAGGLDALDLRTLWRVTRRIARRSLETIAAESGKDVFGDPPKGFLFHVRWSRGGRCPRDGAALSYETIGGRTTVWCPACLNPRYPP